MSNEASFNLAWIILLGTGLIVELVALLNKENGDTLSERTRAWFQVHKRPGWMIFAVAWVAFSAWFLVHILG